MSERLLTARELAEYVGLSSATVLDWYENGKQRTRGGFETRTSALDYANGKADWAIARANAIRFGDALPAPTQTIATVSELVDPVLARHRVDEATLRKLRSQLKHATTAFGDRRPETLQPIELDLWRSRDEIHVGTVAEELIRIGRAAS